MGLDEAFGFVFHKKSCQTSVMCSCSVVEFCCPVEARYKELELSLLQQGGSTK